MYVVVSRTSISSCEFSISILQISKDKKLQWLHGVSKCKPLECRAAYDYPVSSTPLSEPEVYPELRKTSKTDLFMKIVNA